MKKILILLSFLFVMTLSANEPVKTNQITTVKITIVDSTNNEPLSGVFEKNSKLYSNNGTITITKNDSAYLSLISYNTIKLNSISNDTIIKMIPVKP